MRWSHWLLITINAYCFSHCARTVQTKRGKLTSLSYQSLWSNNSHQKSTKTWKSGSTVTVTFLERCNPVHFSGYLAGYANVQRWRSVCYILKEWQTLCFEHSAPRVRRASWARTDTTRRNRPCLSQRPSVNHRRLLRRKAAQPDGLNKTLPACKRGQCGFMGHDWLLNNGVLCKVGEAYNRSTLVAGGDKPPDTSHIH